MAISIVEIARSSIKFSAVNILTAVIALPVGIYVATILVPYEYGIYGFLGLWSMYSSLIRPGLTISGYREIPVLLGQGKEEEALRLQNITITSDIIYSIIPFIIILAASFFFTNPLQRYGLILTAVGYGATQLVKYWNGINFLRQNFNTIAKVKFISAILSPLVILVSVYWIKVYALLIAPIVVAFVSGIYYWKWGPINFRFIFDWEETKRLAKIGIILQAGALVLWGFRLADRTIIASTLPMEQLGIYTFAIGLVTTILTIPTDFTNVMQPVIYKELGKASSAFEGFKDTQRIAIYLALGTSMLIPITQLGFYLVVNLITTNYIASIPIFNVLSYNIFLTSAVPVANIILISSVVDKQRISLLVHTIGLVCNIIFDFLVISWGYGIVGVAWVTICTQGLVTLTLFYFARNYMCRTRTEYSIFQLTMLAPFLCAVLFYFFHNYLNNATNNLWIFTGFSLIAQIAVWSVFIGIFHRSYLSLSDIKIIMREIFLTVKSKWIRRAKDKPVE